MVVSRARPETRSETVVVERASEVQTLLDAVDDVDCRAILDATGDEALSASELSDACDLPLSTTYRKLERLTDAGLLEERTRVRRSGKHASEYVRTVERLTVSLDGGDGATLEVSSHEAPSRTAPFQ